MTTEQQTDNLFTAWQNKKCRLDAKQNKHFAEIFISLNICCAVLKLVKGGSDNPVLQFGLLRSVAIELNNIAGLLKPLPIGNDLIDKRFPNLTQIRNGICHIEDRVQMVAKPSRKKKHELVMGKSRKKT